MKFWNNIIEKSKVAYFLYFRADIFNPFKERDPNEIIPTFNFLPQIALNLRRSNKFGMESVRIILGWLNAYIEFSVFRNKKLTY